MTTAAPFHRSRRLRRVLLRTSQLRVGEFHCAPGDRRWVRTNTIGAGHHLVFPTTRVRICRGSHRSDVDPGCTVFYRPWEAYDRSLVDPRGDHCVFVALADGLLAEVARDTGAPLTPDGVLAAATGPLDSRLYLRVRSWPAQLGRGELAAEQVLATVRAAVAATVDGHDRVAPRRSATQRAHRDLAAAARAVLAEDLALPLTLDDVAARVAASPYHLARVFRAVEGRTMQRYRMQLRVQEALERLADPLATAAQVADELGFASPAHLTTACRRHLGVPPSRARAMLADQTSRIV